MDRHERRAEWLRANIGEVLNWLVVDSALKWNVEPLITVSQQLLTPFLQSSRLRVISYEQLLKEQEKWG